MTHDSSAGVEERDVLLVGGGIAGIEALMALADLGDNRLRLRLVCDRPAFVLARDALGVPWGGPLLHVDLERMCRAFGARFALGTVTGVDPTAHRVFTADGGTLAYERLLLAPGARRRFAYASTPTLGFGVLPDALASTSGSVAVIVADHVTWTLPAYQLALMAAGDGRDVRVLTAERDVLEVFGPGTHKAVRALLARHGVVVETGGAPEPGATADGLADTVVALPRLDGPAIAGLPQDGRGFLPVDAHGRVRGVADVHAAGDATDHMIKQGGLAAQHADLAATEIVRSCGGDPEPLAYAPTLRGKLIATGGEELYLSRALDGLDHGRASAEALWQPPSAVCAWRLARWLAFHRTELEQGAGTHAG